MDNLPIIISVFSVLLSILSFMLLFLYFPTSKSKTIELKNPDKNNINVQNRKFFDNIVRLFDLLFSLLCFLIASPILLITFIAIKSSTNVSAIKKIKIVGKGGKSVNLCFFRTDENIESNNLRTFLKNTSLDCLPQLYNVIKGDISIFGLSRIKTEDLQLAQETIPNILEPYEFYKPGLVGLAVLKKRNFEKPYFEFLHISNIEFLNNRSFKLFFQMSRRTVYFSFKPID